MTGSVVLFAAALFVLPSGALAEESGDEDAHEVAPEEGSAKKAPEEPSQKKEPAEDDAEEASEPDDAPADGEEAPAESEAEEAPADDDADEAPVEDEPKKAAPKEKAPNKRAPDDDGHREKKKAPPAKDAEKGPPARSRKSDKRRAKSDDEDEETETEKKEVIHQVRPNRHIRIRARSVKLKSKSRSRLLNIAKRYHEATGKKLLITGGDRTPHRQAELMYRMLAKGNDLLKLYTQVRLVLELTHIYEAGKEKKRGARNIIRDMGKAIKKQVERGQYVSHHLAFTAADVRSRGLKDAHVDALRKAVRAEPGAKLVDERKSDAPHFHLSL